MDKIIDILRTIAKAFKGSKETLANTRDEFIRYLTDIGKELYERH